MRRLHYGGMGPSLALFSGAAALLLDRSLYSYLVRLPHYCGAGPSSVRLLHGCGIGPSVVRLPHYCRTDPATVWLLHYRGIGPSLVRLPNY